jgi:hypothetical protein
VTRKDVRVTQISLDTVVVAAERQVSSALGEDTVILHVEQGMYYGLDPVGTSIWETLKQPSTVREIRDRILAGYVVEPERCERELIALLGQLVEKGLVEMPRGVGAAG